LVQGDAGHLQLPRLQCLLPGPVLQTLLVLSLFLHLVQQALQEDAVGVRQGHVLLRVLLPARHNPQPLVQLVEVLGVHDTVVVHVEELLEEESKLLDLKRRKSLVKRSIIGIFTLELAEG